ncbi:MAG: acyl-CoA thioesterase [Anaerolineales bacterium]
MPRTSKSSRTSRTILSQLMQPEHSNTHGNVHGGWIMKMVDEAGALACMRHAQHRVVTVAIDQMTFSHPIRIGDLVVLEAEVSYVGRTSMEAEVKVYAENPVSGEKWATNTAYVVYVALDGDGHPVMVPELLLESEMEKRRFEQGKARQQYRISQKNE